MSRVNIPMHHSLESLKAARVGSHIKSSLNGSSVSSKAREIGVDRGTLARIMKERSGARSETLEKIAEGVGMTLNALLQPYETDQVEDGEEEPILYTPGPIVREYLEKLHKTGLHGTVEGGIASVMDELVRRELSRIFCSEEKFSEEGSS